MAAELPSTAEDILPFAQAIAAGDAEAVSALSHVAGAVAVRLEDTPGLYSPTSEPATLRQFLAARGRRSARRPLRAIFVDRPSKTA